MRLGINYAAPHKSPEHWADELVARGYRSTVFPVNYKEPVSKIDAYVKAAAERDILIAEVGIWNSPNHKDAGKAQEAKEYCLEQFRLAEYVKARCCVNVSGAEGELWYYCYKENYSQDLYKRNVEFAQYLCDTVKPVYTNYTLEPMQWMLPDSPKQYKQFLKDVNREHCKVHMDIFNFVKDPYSFVYQDELMDEAFELLGEDIVSCHLKDIRMANGTTVVIEETYPGDGTFNIEYYLQKINELNPDVPVLIEHLNSMEEYDHALASIRAKYGEYFK